MMSPAGARTRTTRSGVERTNHEATAPPHDDYDMKTFKFLRVLCVAVFLPMTYNPCANAISNCESQDSTSKKALKGPTYDTFRVNSPDVCVKRCVKGKQCQSINFVIDESICELNNRSMEARPDGYVTDPRRIYMTVYFNRGRRSNGCLPP